MPKPGEHFEETKKVKGLTVRVIRLVEEGKPEEEGKLVDLRLDLTDHQYARLIKEFNNKELSWENSCNTTIFQNNLRGFTQKALKEKPKWKKPEEMDLTNQLEKWSAQYQVFEEMLNAPPGIHPLRTLLIELDKLEKFMTQNKMPEAMRKDLAEFRNKTDHLRKRVPAPTPRQIQLFFSATPENPKIPCLGKFLAEQNALLAEYGMAEVFGITVKRTAKGGKISEAATLWNRLKEVFSLNPLYKSLSDARSDVGKKGKSLHGARFNCNRSPVPRSMTETINPSLLTDNTRTKSTSIMPYLERPDDLGELNNLLETFIGENYTDGKPRWRDIGLVYGANLVEFLFLALPRITMAGLGAIAYSFGNLALYVIGQVVDNTEQKLAWNALFTRFDNWCGNWYRGFSKWLVVGAKNNRNEHLELDPSLKNFIPPISYFDKMLELVNSRELTSYVNKAAIGIWKALKASIRTTREILHLIKKEKPETVAQKYHHKLNEIIKGLKDEQLAAAPSDKGNTVVDLTPKDRPTVQPWQPGEFDSFLAVADEVVVGFCHLVVEPMFRKSPGLSTMMFLFAHASLGALTVPALGSAMPTFFKTLPIEIAHAFMGKTAGAGESLLTNVFAVTLQWKLTFFGAELASSIAHQDMDYFKKILHNPEQLTLAMIVSVAMGHVLAMMPNIPDKIPLGGDRYVINFYALALDIIGLEAREAVHGTFGLNFFELAFLSVKTAFFVETLLSGSHEGMDPHLQQILKRTYKNDEKSIIDHDPLKLIMINMKALMKGQSLAEIKNGQGEEKLKAMFRVAITQYTSANEPLIGFKPSEHDISNLVEVMMKQVDGAIEESKQALGSMQEGTILALESKLLEAFNFVEQMEMAEQNFESHSEATAYYNYLYKLIKDYNYEQRKHGHWDRQLDKREMLQSFYNQYCYKGSPNSLRVIFTIPPVYFLTLFWRGLQYVFIRDKLFGPPDPAVAYKTKRAWAKDKAIAWQGVSVVGVAVNLLALTYTYMVRAILLVPLLGVAILSAPFGGFAPVMNGGVDRLLAFRPYENTTRNLAAFISSPLRIIDALFKTNLQQGFRDWVDMTARFGKAAHQVDKRTVDLIGHTQELKQTVAQHQKERIEKAESHTQVRMHHSWSKSGGRNARREIKETQLGFAREVKVVQELCDKLEDKTSQAFLDAQTTLQKIRANPPDEKLMPHTISTLRGHQEKLAKILEKVEISKP